MDNNVLTRSSSFRCSATDSSSLTASGNWSRNNSEARCGELYRWRQSNNILAFAESEVLVNRSVIGSAKIAQRLLTTQAAIDGSFHAFRGVCRLIN